MTDAAVPITPTNFPVYWLAATNVTPESYAISAAPAATVWNALAELLSKPASGSANPAATGGTALTLLAPTGITTSGSASTATAAALLANT
jgi:hypothetical protein